MDSKKTILIADDDDGHTLLIQRNLRRAGLANPVRRFRNGEELLEFLSGLDRVRMAAAGAPCLLLLDIRMPRVDGLDVLRTIRAMEGMQHLKVIVLTTSDNPEEVRRCYELGCTNYLVKPVTEDRFAEMIRSLGVFVSSLRLPDPAV